MTAARIWAAVALTACLAAAAEPAHREIRLDDGRYYLESASGARQLADVTGYCVGCHGGESGEPTHAETPGPDIGALGRSHPVDLAYPTDREGLAKPEDLDSRLELSDGELTCLTCHRADAPDHRLVIPARGGELCQACHLQ